MAKSIHYSVSSLKRQIVTVHLTPTGAVPLEQNNPGPWLCGACVSGMKTRNQQKAIAGSHTMFSGNKAMKEKKGDNSGVGWQGWGRCLR